MKEISLRKYHQQIEKLIEGGNVKEAIAHCEHILRIFPMNLNTYRLLGKSYLESRKYKDAADIFQRLLMSIPDDFVSHVGMSIIRDDEKDLEDSIWHMERAFEVQPSNPAIQEELKKLYGRRDGKQPSKIRLTRDALANMYTQGALYSQAIAEIQSVLAEDPDRADLKVMLARAYSKEGNKKQAVEICTELLKKQPYCFDALEILVNLLSSPENQQLVSGYQSRIFAMDPYAEHSAESNIVTQDVPDNAVMISYLDAQSDSTTRKMEDKQEQPAVSQFQESDSFMSSQLNDREGIKKGSDDSSSFDTNLEKIKINAKTDIPDWIKELAPENIEDGNLPEEVEQTPDQVAQSIDDLPELSQPEIGTPIGRSSRKFTRRYP